MTSIRPGTLARLAVAIPLVTGLLSARPVTAQENPPAMEQLPRVVESIESLDDLRERLATSFLGEGGVEADRETFTQVCKPVGKKARSLSEENPWQVRQMAVKYRNPKHEADEEARRIHRLMEEDPDLRGLWIRDTVDGREGIRYFRRITVRQACMECHGPKDDRPEFIRENFPQDRAYGFEVGDLRGVYSVFVPAAGPEGEARGD
jgi:hypothetical protein